MSSRKALWSVAVFAVFAFATLIVFFWIRDGSLQQAGASMDNLLHRTGNEIASTTTEVVDSTGAAIDRATDGDDRT
ncbi:MAG: hypothetical protein EON61_07185 [Alphaproteobacteria bacterium]|jgi:hypothetical protein|nr:MAG: hypothetical protein EON61_16905 [Alphaproteobacteria bacterium]RYZ13453.1 MAG: hypothetical protein EON61_07185 [Alphaproteobacteria bacterium]